MARKLILLCLLFLSNLLLFVCVVGNSNGLTLKLIHRDSLQSPSYQPNLTREERLQRFFSQSGQHDMDPETVRGRVHFHGPNTFMVKVNIGTFPNQAPPYKTYFLLLDTGSSIIWTQCEECRTPPGHCFEQSEPFPPSHSRSYRPLSVAARPPHHLCDEHKFIGELCAYHIPYLDGGSSSGILGEDQFTFDSNTGHLESVRIVFGCGFDNRNLNDFNRDNGVAGILGLGWDPHSLQNQLGNQSRGIFSYCLPLPNGEAHSSNTLLRFGGDIVHHQSLRTTPLVQYPGFDQYYVVLLGLSINGRRLSIPPGVFAMRGEHGGTIMDSGSAASHLVPAAYHDLRLALKIAFLKIEGLHPLYEPRLELDLCYRRPASFSFQSLPTITFHFDGVEADLHVRPQSGFVMGEYEGTPYFCLAMLPSRYSFSLIGGYQQANQRFVFDTHSHLLHFGPQDCKLHS